MHKHTIECVVGAIIITISLLFCIFLYNHSNLVYQQDGYKIYALFDRVDGLKDGSDVKMSGIKIGSIVSQEIEKSNYQALIGMNIKSDIVIPVDTTAAVLGDGLIGSKYIALVPGYEEKRMKPGEYIENTQSSISFEQLLGKFLFSANKS